MFAVIYGFLLSYFKPSFLLSVTVTTGGDTSSHYLTADYLVNELLPQGRIIGWMPGNYAGFPLFQFYFPFPFLIMALLNLFIPLQVAFKLVTVLGVFLLPACAALCLRFLGFRFPVPILGAIFSLPFLFMESNSMWGGNIPSTLAGEFAYSIGLALFFVYAGLFYKGILENKYAVVNAVLLTMIGLCHGYTLLFAVFATLFFLFTTRGFIQRTWYYLKVNGIAFLMLGFWIIQLLWFMPYTTRFNFVWVLKGILQVFPPILLPVIALASAGGILHFVQALRPKTAARRPGGVFGSGGRQTQTAASKKRENGRLFLWFICLLAAVFYLVAYNMNVVDIRFIPFIQFCLMLLGAVGLFDLASRLPGHSVLPLFFVVLTVPFVNSQVTYIPAWIAWNYAGFEKKGVWPRFKAVHDYLKGTCADPRVAYEHDPKHETAGTIRAFEMLPYFSGRSTLEGLYIQSTVTSPFVFYVQSEISAKPSTPLPDYNYSRLNIERGIRHLTLFNVSHLIVVTDKLRKELMASGNVMREADFPPYTVYRLKNNADHYVSVLENDPVLLITGDWRSEAFQWFRKSDLNTFVAFKSEFEPEDAARFQRIIDGALPDDLKNFWTAGKETGPAPSHRETGVVTETVRTQEIMIETRAVGRPHLVRISYHPNWHVEGADRIYPVSPSLMLIFPRQEHVRLYFGPTFPNYAGYVLSVLGLAVVFGHVVWRSRMVDIESRILQTTGILLGDRFSDAALRRRLLRTVALIITAMTLGVVLLVHQHDAITIYSKGFSYYDQGDYAKARKIFKAAMKEFPYSPIIGRTAFHYGVSFFKEERWEEALESFQQTAADFPESRMFSEVLYHIGICRLRLDQRKEAVEVFERILGEFRDDRWAVHAEERLREIGRKPGR